MDEEALAARFLPDALRLAHWFGRRYRLDPDECASTAGLVLLLTIRSHDPAKLPFLRWLALRMRDAICTLAQQRVRQRKQLRLYRQKARSRTPPLPAPLSAPEGWVEAEHARHLLRILPRRDGDVLWRRRVLCESQKQIALEMGVSDSLVSLLCSRAEERMLEHLRRRSNL